MRVKSARLLSPSQAAAILGVSYPTLKQWIHRRKVRAIKTPGGHYRIPEEEVDRFLFAKLDKTEVVWQESRTHISGRNQLVGRIIRVRISGLLAQVTLSIGGQHITSIITADAADQLDLKPGDTVAALIKSTEVMIIRP